MADKLNIKAATISDKIYIKEDDIEDRSSFENAYTYQIVDDFHYTYEYNDNNGVYAVPSNSYHKLKMLHQHMILDILILFNIYLLELCIFI